MPKADPSSRRPNRRPKLAKLKPRAERAAAPAAPEQERLDSDFGLVLRLGPALRRRPDA